MKFGYEDLSVWDMAVNFAVDVITVVENISPIENITVSWNK